MYVFVTTASSGFNVIQFGIHLIVVIHKVACRNGTLYEFLFFVNTTFPAGG